YVARPPDRGGWRAARARSRAGGFHRSWAAADALAGGADLASEAAVDVCEVARREEHARDPPGQPDPEAMNGSRHRGGGQAQLACGARGQDVRVQAEGHGGEHAGDVGARGEEGVTVAPPRPVEDDADQAQDGD